MKFNVLLVSSHPAEATAIYRMLDPEIFNCVVVSSYRQAIAALCWNAYDSILCDEYLVDGTWKDIVGQIAELPQGPSVLVLASGIEDNDRETVLELGAYDLIARPVEAPVLVNALLGACSLSCIGQLAAHAASSY
jgi:DNA-binding response OmpR family regulator